MGRDILAIVIGYIIISVTIMIGFTLAFVLMGAVGAFVDQTWDVSTNWLVMSFAVGFVAAIIGGATCAAIAESNSRAPLALAVVVAVLGIIMAIPAMNAEPNPDPRPEEITMFQAMTSAEQPVIAFLVNPFIGAVGVIVGASAVGRGKT